MGSAGAKALAEKLGCKRVFPDKAYKGKGGDLIVNWGASQMPSWTFPPRGYLNHPNAVRTASNKHSAFSVMLGEIITPAYTTSKDSVKAWFDTGAKRVYCRRILTGHSGNGIVVIGRTDKIPDAPLYVKGITGMRDEYRVHVFKGNMIDVQMKRKKVDAAVDQLIRSHNNGYVYCRDDIPPLSDDAMEAAINSVEILGLDFGAVDIIVMRDDPADYYVLEVNTAPGLEGTTLTRYADTIGDYYDELDT
jgi:predicted ATP-grasp superfamily ATP-dependent carboligase